MTQSLKRLPPRHPKTEEAPSEEPGRRMLLRAPENPEEAPSRPEKPEDAPAEADSTCRGARRAVRRARRAVRRAVRRARRAPADEGDGDDDFEDDDFEEDDFEEEDTSDAPSQKPESPRNQMRPLGAARKLLRRTAENSRKSPSPSPSPSRARARGADRAPRGAKRSAWRGLLVADRGDFNWQRRRRRSRWCLMTAKRLDTFKWRVFVFVRDASERHFKVA